MPTVIQEIAAKLIASNAGFKNSSTIIGFQIAPNPLSVFTKTFDHNTPTAPAIIKGIND